ncbi:hypothetical protein LC087_03765 [Bacillus carboniphilus]|uniref:Uncharacterized protein n=1 Tax=Bacillus carboniphilus TaxID=86663 RepID=A0ABY9JV83_9BACI|nr:hypothetical protein [Bacillus carboniphilus]WLR43316.1 hypothetical protein LC087_03765 [Bacillus carboniphilus]
MMDYQYRRMAMNKWSEPTDKEKSNDNKKSMFHVITKLFSFKHSLKIEKKTIKNIVEFKSF